MRAKKWSLCQVFLCKRGVARGGIERDVTRRYCAAHMPGGKVLVALGKANEARFRGSKCHALSRKREMRPCRFTMRVQVLVVIQDNEPRCRVEGCFHVPIGKLQMCGKHQHHVRAGKVLSLRAPRTNSHPVFSSVWSTDPCESHVSRCESTTLVPGKRIDWWHTRPLWRVKENVGRSRDMGKAPGFRVDCVLCGDVVDERDDCVEVLCEGCA